MENQNNNVIESYSDCYTWFQYLLQIILYWLCPRFTEAKLMLSIEKEKQNPPSSVPTEVGKDFSVSLMRDAKCRTHVLSPTDGKKPEVLILFYHGGSYCVGFTAPFHFEAAALIAREIMVPCQLLMVDYPLVPNVNHETLFDLLEEHYRQVVAELLPKGCKVVLMGDSAGGGIALILAQRLTAIKDKGDGMALHQPDCIVLMSPWLDVSMTNPACAELAAVDPFLDVNGLRKAGELLADGLITTKDPKVSPLYGSMRGLPPINLWTSTHDILLPDSRSLRDKFKNEKVASTLRYFERKGLMHCFVIFPVYPQLETIQEIVLAIQTDCQLESKVRS